MGLLIPSPGARRGGLLVEGQAGRSFRRSGGQPVGGAGLTAWGGWRFSGPWCACRRSSACGLVRCPCHVAPRSRGTGTPALPPGRLRARCCLPLLCPRQPPTPRLCFPAQLFRKLFHSQVSPRMTGSLTWCIYCRRWEQVSLGFLETRGPRWPSLRPCDLHRARHPGARGPSSWNQTPDFKIICVFSLSALRIFRYHTELISGVAVVPKHW